MQRDRLHQFSFLFLFLVTALTVGCGGDDGTTVGPGDGGSDPPRGWVQLFPQPQGNSLYDVHMTDNNRVIAVGGGGTIVRTTNGGASWNVVRGSNRFRDLTGISMAGNFGMAVGFDGAVLSTRDGGVSWRELDIGVDTADLWCVDVVDELTAWIVGQGGLIRKTNDGGDTWEIQDVVAGEFLSVSIRREDPREGFVVGSGGSVLWTNDGGSTWYPRNIAARDKIRSVVATARGTAIAGGDLRASTFDEGVIYTTDNGGGVWTERFTSPRGIRDVVMFNRLEGFALDDPSRVYTTSDGGITWTGLPHPIGHLAAMSTLDGRMVAGVGYSGELLRSMDGCESWTRQTTTLGPSLTYPQCSAVWFTSRLNGLVATQQHGLLHTDDGGKSWSHRIPTGYFLELYFFDETRGLAVILDEAMMETTDGGLTWFRFGFETRIRHVHFADAEVGIGTGVGAFIRRTTDGGRSWDAITDPPAVSLVQPFLVNRDTVLVLASGGEIYQSANGGVTSWLKRTVPYNVNAVDFNKSRTIGLVACNRLGDDGIVIRTIDAGVSWQEYTAGTQNFKAVTFVDELTAFAVGDRGEVVKTIDGGITWETQEIQSVASLRDVFFVSPEYGVVVGMGGTILITHTGGE